LVTDASHRDLFGRKDLARVEISPTHGAHGPISRRRHRYRHCLHLDLRQLNLLRAVGYSLSSAGMATPILAHHIFLPSQAGISFDRDTAASG
jgi:hypothetical protein